MDELRVVNKKKKELILAPTTALIKVDNLVNENSLNLTVFNCTLSKTLSGHDSDILCLTASDNKIITGSQDKTIKIWDFKTGKLLNTLTGHNSGIYSLAVYKGKILSASADRTIKIWELATGKLICTLLGHNNHVYSLDVAGDKFISASLDKTIKIWDFETKKLLKVIPTANVSAFTVKIIDDTIVGGLSDGTIKVWDLDSGNLLVSYQEHEDSVTSIAVSNGKFITASKDRTVKIWNFNLDLLYDLRGHKGPVWSINVNSGKIFSGSDDKTIKIWNLADGTFIEELSGHSDWVSCLTTYQGKLISGSGDKTIKIWSRVPRHNCNSINLTKEEVIKSPFETDVEYEQRKTYLQKSLYSKISGYEYINIGKAELIADDYLLDTAILPIKININCDKVLNFSGLSKNYLSNIKIEKEKAHELYKISNIQDLYIRYFTDNDNFKYELVIISGDVKYPLDLILKPLEGFQRKDVKAGRLKIEKGKTDLTEEICNIIPRHDCNTIDTTDTFKSPFEALSDFEKRVRKKLIGYGYINIGKVELLSEKYSIEEKIFPVNLTVTCDKIINISDLKKEVTGKIIVDRYLAKDIYDKSKIHNLFINFYEKGELYYTLSIIFNGTKYIINT